MAARIRRNEEPAYQAVRRTARDQGGRDGHGRFHVDSAAREHHDQIERWDEVDLLTTVPREHDRVDSAVTRRGLHPVPTVPDTETVVAVVDARLARNGGIDP